MLQEWTHQKIKSYKGYFEHQITVLAQNSCFFFFAQDEKRFLC